MRFSLTHPFLAVALCLWAALPAGAAEITSWCIAGGGGRSTAGGWTLTGTVGQPDAGSLSGGNYKLWGGFWTPGSGVTAVGDDDLPPAAGLPRRHSLYDPSPNPFNPRTTIRFDLPQAQRVQLEIVDLRGRVVASLADETLPAGTHERIWSGKDDAGRGVASGVYFARIRAGSFGAVRKLTLVK